MTAVVAVALALFLPPQTGAQVGSSPVPADPSDLQRSVERADSQYFQGRPGEALEILRDLLDQGEDRYRYGALWRASRAALALSFAEDGSEGRIRWYREGAEFARRALERSPDGIEARYWLAANLGLHAIQAPSARANARLGEESYHHARKILEADPLHAGAHNVLGKAYFEVARLPAISRFLGRLLVGGDLLEKASWTGARAHLERAVELDPSMIYFRLDLARLHLARDRPGPARSQLRRILELPAVHPPDRMLKEEARVLLRAGAGGNREGR